MSEQEMLKRLRGNCLARITEIEATVERAPPTRGKVALAYLNGRLHALRDVVQQINAALDAKGEA